MSWDLSDPAVQQQWYQLLDQRQVWRTEDGRDVPVREMSRVDAYWARRWVLDNAAPLLEAVTKVLFDEATKAKREDDDFDPGKGRRPEWDPGEWYRSMLAKPGFPRVSGPVDVMDYAPLVDELGYRAVGEHHPQPEERRETVEGVEVVFYVMLLERGRWTFPESRAREGYESVQDAMTETRLQIGGKLAGPLAKRCGHEIPESEHDAHWREHIQPLLEKGWDISPRKLAELNAAADRIATIAARGLIDEEPSQ
jgi:hypothetical protein